MLRDLIDLGWLEDFLEGLAQTASLRFAVFDDRRERMYATEGRSGITKVADPLPQQLPPRLKELRIPSDEPPAHLTLLSVDGVGYVVAPIYLEQLNIGWVVAGELRIDNEQAEASGLSEAWTMQRNLLPVLGLSSASKPIRIARWAARMLAARCRTERRTSSLAEEASLFGDIAALLTGEEELPRILERISQETAKVMRCPFASIRLYNPVTEELDYAAGYKLSREYLSKGIVSRAGNPIDDEALRGQIVYVEDVMRDSRIQFPEVARKEGIVSILTAGMLYRTRPIGVMRVYTDRMQRFRPRQRELLRAVASQAATAVANARLLEDRLRAAATERELVLAGHVQSRMLEHPLPRHPAASFGRVFSPSRHVSGDFFDFFTLCDGRIASLVADVSGKGVPAALLGASLRGAMRAMSRDCLDLSEFFSRLNRHICAETSSGEFATMAMMALARDAGSLELCSAGHEPPLLLRGGQVERVDHGGTILGLDTDQEFEPLMISLQPGDFALLYTDGAIDAVNFDDRRFGRTALDQSTMQYGHLEAQTAVNSIIWDIRRYAGLADQADDITLVGMKVGGEE
jgi:serine phosphatase RsbU (regulator of sigma subunit)